MFSEQISKIKDLPLPGEASHFKMVPEFRIELMREYAAKGLNAKKAGVLALFYPNREQATNLLLIHRMTYAGVHSDQVGFPGGKMEDGDLDIAYTALRETHEEVGISPDQVRVIKPLSTVYIPPSNFEVYPFLGLVDTMPTFHIQESEVAALLEVPLAHFLDDQRLFSRKMSTSYAHEVEVPAFRLNGYTVWGATAMMLSEIKELLKQVL